MVIALTANQIDKSKHTLGLTNSKKSYRNYYCSGKEKDADLEYLVEKEFMIRQDRGDEMGGYFYHFTDEGKERIKAFIGNFRSTN